jgi:hypothetical protein
MVEQSRSTVAVRRGAAQITVADQSLDLAIYLHEHGMEMPSRVTPPALVEG